MPGKINDTYPRPDFQRSDLNWSSLNGPWSFLFDDEDVGLIERWQQKGLPETANTNAVDELGHGNTESDSTTQKIALGTQDLIQNNAFTRDARTTVNKKQEIKVPFVFQTPASGINDRGIHEVMWYERNVADPRSAEEKSASRRVMLRFGAVDYEAQVWVNGRSVGSHRGGHVPFELDITSELEAEPSSTSQARITVRVYDAAYDLTQPRGKQYWGAQPESIFYTPSGGIWQSVWLEVVPYARLADSSHGTVIRTTDIDGGKIQSVVHVHGRRRRDALAADMEVSFAGVPVSRSEKKTLPKDTNKIPLDADSRLSDDALKQVPKDILDVSPVSNDYCWRNGVALWSPEHPQLYDVVLRLYDEAGTVIDQVHTTAGMRSIDWTKGDGLWRLNGKPYFQALCLDQGYWPETFMTPPTPDSLKRDIELSKKMGFNGCRKHQKVEDPLFYYWADKLGYLVWGEMASAYQFSDEYVDRYNQEWTEAVKLVINRPSVVTWTPVNESWAYTSLKDNLEHRNHIRNLYYMTKYVSHSMITPTAEKETNSSRTLDPTRPINDNCGWEHVCTDLTTFHEYGDAKKVRETCSSLEGVLSQKAERNMFVAPIPGKDPGAKHIDGAPIMCTEFGGINISTGNSGRDWGYTQASNPDDLLARVKEIVDAVIDGGLCCTFVYTQL